MSRTEQTEGATGAKGVLMPTRKTPPHQDIARIDLDAQAQLALDEARAMAPGEQKREALRKAGALRNAADIGGFLFAKRGRPPKL
jgi:hypothetical protein